MSLVVPHNLMAGIAPRNVSSSFASLTASVRHPSAALRINQANSATDQASGESLAAGSAEQASGALLNTSDAGGAQATAAQNAQSTNNDMAMNSASVTSNVLANLLRP